ncbi:hypothetical protein DQP57_18765 [Mycobacterium colombiense]|uniref:Uncharacterized protein n=1 Tax=Mycobacterium colombiense TaxID=339268 RepID=A0A329LJS6_9MYCO|nr:hypothetical protein DQP57_18765 [Mycobacterium colombiense]
MPERRDRAQVGAHLATELDRRHLLGNLLPIARQQWCLGQHSDPALQVPQCLGDDIVTVVMRGMTCQESSD